MPFIKIEYNATEPQYINTANIERISPYFYQGKRTGSLIITVSGEEYETTYTQDQILEFIRMAEIDTAIEHANAIAGT